MSGMKRRLNRNMSQSATASILERRYRRLLAWYPREHRSAYAEEMLGVALARSAPGQRWPDLGEAVSLIVSGIRTRLGGLRVGYRDPAWQTAVAVLGVIGPFVLTAFSARDVIGALSGSGLAASASTPPRADLVSAVGWLLVAITATVGWRRIAAVGSVLGVVGQVIVLTRDYGDPSGLVTSWWRLVFTAVIALSAVIATGTRGRPLSWRPVAAVVVTGAAIAVYPAVERSTQTITGLPGGGSMVSSPLDGASGLVVLALRAVMAIVLLVVMGRCGPQVRRRLAVLLLPALAALMLVSWTFGGFLAASPRFIHPVSLNGPQWAALTLVPVLVFAAGLFWLARYESMLRSLNGLDGRRRSRELS